ncbi:MalY/PatB family protein [Frondihabitans australicus]|uniref:cysteine-S-conjugate beta-lyase n=1 Tax=Frondihabitans australicus TaxID=386892 RepID=A0A495IGT4_9MICO|nr:aminotransferase class I/II-fold pyridoxal phosphate-dependent enzyme [Frondihabitans australicus]RKR75197.1 cystathionine beta-lyase [Frondihabitans australicus]
MPGDIDELDPTGHIRSARTSIKWTRYAPSVLPLFVAEMDYGVAPGIQEALIERVRQSDLGYLDGPGPLAPAFAGFAERRWGWRVDPSRVHIATDVSVGIVETLRVALPDGGDVVITPPVYPPFFELVDEARCRVAEVPLVERWGEYSLDLDGLERAFLAGARVFLLCNPHNPIGLVHSHETLAAVADLAARYDVLVVSDEIHGPLTHPGVVFTPFATVAESRGARSVTVTSASKGWNLAGVKCSVVVAGDDRSAALLDTLNDEVACRTSILGLHANMRAFEHETEWLDEAVARVASNARLLAALVRDQLPGVVFRMPRAGYLAWLDFRGLGLGDDPAVPLREHAYVALNSGLGFGREGRGFARLNLACEPDTLREAVARIAAAYPSSMQGAVVWR